MPTLRLRLRLLIVALLAVTAASAVWSPARAQALAARPYVTGHPDWPTGLYAFGNVHKPNEVVTSQREYDLALLSCAKSALEAGYDYFVIVESSASGPRPTREQVYAAPFGTASGGSTDAAGVVRFAGRTFRSVPPRNFNIVVAFSAAPDGVAYNSEQVINELKAKYGL